MEEGASLLFFVKRMDVCKCLVTFPLSSGWMIERVKVLCSFSCVSEWMDKVLCNFLCQVGVWMNVLNILPLSSEWMTEGAL